MATIILDSRKSGQNWTPEEFHDRMMEEALNLCEPKYFFMYENDGVHWSVLYTKGAFVDGWLRVAFAISRDEEDEAAHLAPDSDVSEE